MDFRIIINYLLFLMIYSFLGWLYESILKTVTQKKLVNSGFLFGPFCPIYGVGAVIMLIFLNWIQNPILIFIVGFFVLSVWEYIVGWGLEKVFNIKYWDYSNFRFNIKGRVCLQTSVVWGVFSVLFIKLLHPFIEEFVIMASNRVAIYVTCLVGIYFIIDTILSIIKVNNINIELQIFTELGEVIKEKLEELKENTEKTLGKPFNSEKVQELIEELKIRQEKSKERLEKQRARLKKAFPHMKEQIRKRTLEVQERIEEIKKRINTRLDD